MLPVHERLYLYGLERRLIVDSTRPDEVDDEDRRRIVDELLRLLDVFGGKSRSLCHYIGCLLLYDGSVFDTMSAAEIDRLFHRGAADEKSWMKRFEDTDNFAAMSYMMVARLLEHGRHPSVKEICALAKAQVIAGDRIKLLGIERSELFEESFEKLLERRISHVSLTSDANRRGTSSSRLYTYKPASPALIKKAPDAASIMKRITEDELPLKLLGDVAVACHRDLADTKEILSSSTMRGLDTLAFDAVGSLMENDTRLSEALASSSVSTYVPMSALESAAASLGVSLSFTGKGLLTQASQHLIAKMAAFYGWQAVLPDIIECRASNAWKCGRETSIVMFKRGVAFDSRSGKQGMVRMSRWHWPTYSPGSSRTAPTRLTAWM